MGLDSDPSFQWRRSVKRKIDEAERGFAGESPHFAGGPAIGVPAKVEFENECFLLREALSKQQKTIKELYTELEEERNASSSAANEAMSMMLRIQREKAEIQMEFRQFKRFAEEKMAHDQQEILNLEEAFYKRDQTVQALSCEVQSYKHRLLSFGIDPDERGEVPNEFDSNEIDRDDSDNEAGVPVFDNPFYDYPPLRCNIVDVDMDEEIIDLDKYTSTPRTPIRNVTREHLHHIEQRICRMERNSSSGHLNVLEKGVLVGNSPLRPKHSRMFSTDSVGSFNGHDYPRCEEIPSMVDRNLDVGDDATDRVYTVDTVHGVYKPMAPIGGCDDCVSTPRDLGIRGNMKLNEPDIQKLYMRLQALEADRESLKHEIMSMRTDKAQLVLLREIAQNLCRDAANLGPVPERRIVKSQALFRGHSIISVFKWIASFVFWRREAGRSKYTFGLSHNNVGLLIVLDKYPSMRQWRCLTKLHPRLESTVPFRLTL